MGHPKTTKVGAVLSWLKTGVLTHHMFNCLETVCQMFRVLGILGIILLNVHGVRRPIRDRGRGRRVKTRDMHQTGRPRMPWTATRTWEC